jgi:hypothetical protein
MDHSLQGIGYFRYRIVTNENVLPQGSFIKAL